MPELTPQELKRILSKLDDVCRQAQDLQVEIREKMSMRARENAEAASAARKPPGAKLSGAKPKRR